ncbi:thioester domain-containing protein [Enterococcus faecalis]|uniref:thioester domain-containing protein n=1 Tax=Enterococcus faecalis TaxID=1351 RepID=UPI002FBE57CD
MKLKQSKQKLWIWSLLVFQLVVIAFTSLVANAAITHPNRVTIEYDVNRLYIFRGTNSNRTPFYTVSTGLFAVSGKSRTPVFCIEPGLVISYSATPGYTAGPLPVMNNKAKMTSALWKYAGTNMDTEMVAQTIIWEEVNGIRITSITKPNGLLMTNYGAIKQKINKVVTDYQKKPSFNNQTVKLTVGESVTLTDTNNASLVRFDRSILNSANISYSIAGNKLTLTPKNNSAVKGGLSIIKSRDMGTPVVYKKLGQQTVIAGALNDPSAFKINIEVIKTAPIVVEHRDKVTNELLKTTTETKTIGSNYSYKPINPLRIKDKTYVPQTTTPKTGTVKPRGNKVVFYYDLERTITISHVDKRTNALIVPKTVEKKRRGQKYTYNPRKDLKKGTYSYRVLTPNPVNGTVGGNNINVTFYYDLPLMDIGFKHIEIHTANAKKGLPLKLLIDKTALYNDTRNEYAKQKVTVQVIDKTTRRGVYEQSFMLRDLPKEITTTIAPKFLTKDQQHNYEVRLLGLKTGEIVSKAEKIDTDGYTASEKQINVTPKEAPHISYKNVIMTERDYGRPMVKKYEQFRMDTVKLSDQKTGYGFHYAVIPSYETDLSIVGIKRAYFDLFLDAHLVEKTLSYPIVDNKTKLSLEATLSNVTSKSIAIKQELPTVFLEKESGNVFSEKQKQKNDPAIKEPLVPGGRKVYVPMWIDLGNYDVILQSREPIGVNEIQVKVTDQLPVKAYMFGHVKSPSIKQDEIILSPARSDNPFPNGVPKDFTESDLKWFKDEK